MSKALPKRTPLPSKEASLFKELLTLYETRQLKKGLKTADQILKKFPDHGETLCMKGLVLTHMGRREEGIELVKKGVRLDLTSHICWHVFGLIQKADKNYEEALKSYTQALRFDKENMNLLRDSAQLQTHLRLYENLVETRHFILKVRPNQRQNWIALALAHHLNGNPKEAKAVLDHYQRSLKNVPDYDYEHSETLLYYIIILEELGELSEALSVLDTSAKSRAIVDRTAILEFRARLLSKQGAPEAEEAWRALIEHNADNYSSYRGYLSTLGISLESPSSSSEALAKLEELSTQLPRATAPRRLQLTISSGEDFKKFIRPYIVKNLAKGVPSLFTDIKTLYVDAEKRQVIEDLVESLKTEYAKLSSTTPSDATNAEAEPTTYLWTLYFLAQHYSYLNQPTKALELLEEAITHTPTLPELYLCKGRALKRVGDYLGAAKAVNEARFLDGQDRFINTKCGKYLLRAGMVDEATGILGLFTKKDALSPAADLEDMQSLLFLLESGDSYSRLNKPNMALKRYMSVKKVFDEWEDDQFDFHGYNLRKFTISIYLRLLAWEDTLRAHPAYVKAAIEASKIFVKVNDDPTIVTSLTSTSQLTDAEKKAKKKAKKAAASKAQDDKKAQPSAHDPKDLEPPVPKDDDPEGLKLLGCSDPLEQAAKLLHPLVVLAERTLTGEKSKTANEDGKGKGKQEEVDKNVVKNVEVWIAVYDVAIRRSASLSSWTFRVMVDADCSSLFRFSEKLLQAVGALTRASALSPSHPEVHIRIVDLKQRIAAFPQPPPAPIGPVFTESVSKLLPPDEISMERFNSEYLQRHSGEPAKVLAAARVMKVLDAPIGSVEETVFGVFGEGSQLDISTALSALEFLTSTSSSRVDEFRQRCQAKFELSTAFKAPNDLAQLKEQVLAVPLANQADGPAGVLPEDGAN
ncbi:hypothetical protein CVT26_005222 [Gymnopilus dilepis]|uniref:Uncharacterized protein n=1 Tax=Gymnopilus dilepis TaxID=231916 RepID=A0A409W8L6_9AGAR|nr:hypothetical protein CVT26_005222 [Gymnopilus dilepis]